jgi:hypothetical protein
VLDPLRNALLLGALAVSSVQAQSPLPLAGLDGNAGFKIDGVMSGDESGSTVSNAGDVNGDGLDDLLVNARFADPNGSNFGRSYVLFGRSSGFASPLLLSTLSATTGFQLDGEAASDLSGSALAAAGDVNGDGLDDFLIGAESANPNGNDSGRAYLVFGTTTGFPSPLTLSSLNGSNGVKFDGEAAGDHAGASVSSAGDINGDGFADVLIGAIDRGSNGSAYVVFGQSVSFPSALALASLNGQNGFRLDNPGEQLPSVSGLGDVNGDGLDDLIVSGFDPDFSAYSYVLFGSRNGFNAVIPLSTLGGSSGFRIEGAPSEAHLVSAAGDVNGDGLNDLLVAETEEAGNRGSVYLIYGRSSGFPSPLLLSSLSAADGFRLDGELANDFAGVALDGAGDLNGDGLDDLLIGTLRADPNLGAIGVSYVVYGARDRIFRDGSENLNLDQFFPRLNVRASFIGSALRWSNGATCNCDDPPFDFNIYRSGADMAFFWPSGGISAGVASGSAYALLQPGAVIGSDSTFIATANLAASVNWRAGTSGYLGFRFANPNTGFINYGYALIQTTGPTGFPARILRYGVNLTGLPVTIPPE